MISSAKKKLPLVIVENKREFSSEMREQRNPVFSIQGYDQLRVTCAFELITWLELLAKLLIVVNLSIDYRMYFVVWVVQRLVAS